MTQANSSNKRYERVATAISAAIAQGKFQAGDKLPPERDLAEEFSVSRPTVREAMLALALQGLVEARHGSGIYVTGSPKVQALTPDLDIGAFELTEARALFEGEAAALAATVITPEQIARLEGILQDMVTENTIEARSEHADRRFHMAIAEATGNSAIMLVIESLWDMRERSPLSRHMLAMAREVGVKPMIEEHRAIIEALRSGEPANARRAMRSHLERVIEGLLKATEGEALDRVRQEAEMKRNSYARRRAI